MTIHMSDMPCVIGANHAAGPSVKTSNNVYSITCGKCGMLWGAIVEQIEAEYIPDVEATEQFSRWKGSTYEWEFDGDEWYPLMAPEGATLFGDLPLRPAIITYGDAWQKF